MRFTKESDLHPLIQTIPHLAFEVDNIGFVEELGYEVILKENTVDGVQVRFIDYHGIPIEFLQFDINENEVWPNPTKKVFNGEGEIPDLLFKYDRVYYQGSETTIHPNNPFGIQILKEQSDLGKDQISVEGISFLANETTWQKEGQCVDNTRDQILIQENDLSIRLIMA